MSVTINSKVKKVTAFAPATSANVAVGFDLLGFAMAGVGDRVTLTPRSDHNLVLQMAHDRVSLPVDVHKNTASAVVVQLLKELGLSQGFDMVLDKGIALCSGMGGSAASAVAALCALNGFLTPALTPDQICQAALYGEQVATGSAHGDNIVPCVMGGLTLLTDANALKVKALPVPDLWAVVVHPDLEISTAKARQLLEDPMPLPLFVAQSAYLASFLVGVYEKDYALLSHALKDVLVEPKRKQLIPGFDAVKQAALDRGAIGCSISGAGPAMFAWVKNQAEAEQVAEAMVSAFADHHLQAESWVFALGQPGAQIESMEEE